MGRTNTRSLPDGSDRRDTSTTSRITRKGIDDSFRSSDDTPPMSSNTITTDTTATTTTTDITTTGSVQAMSSFHHPAIYRPLQGPVSELLPTHRQSPLGPTPVHDVASSSDLTTTTTVTTTIPTTTGAGGTIPTRTVPPRDRSRTTDGHPSSTNINNNKNDRSTSSNSSSTREKLRAPTSSTLSKRSTGNNRASSLDTQSTIWSRISEEEERQAKLRNRLEQIRLGDSQRSSSMNEDDDLYDDEDMDDGDDEVTSISSNTFGLTNNTNNNDQAIPTVPRSELQIEGSPDGEVEARKQQRTPPRPRTTPSLPISSLQPEEPTMTRLGEEHQHEQQSGSSIVQQKDQLPPPLQGMDEDALERKTRNADMKRMKRRAEQEQLKAESQVVGKPTIPSTTTEQPRGAECEQGCADSEEERQKSPTKKSLYNKESIPTTPLLPPPPLSSALESSSHQQQQRRVADHQEQRHFPGAYSIDGPDASERGRTRTVSPTGQIHGDDADNDYCLANDSPRQQQYRGNKTVVAVAAMVVDDDLAEKQLQLQQYEEALTEKMARLQAWEEELEKRRQQLELLQAPPGVVQAEVIWSPPTMPDQRPQLHQSWGGVFGSFMGGNHHPVEMTTSTSSSRPPVSSGLNPPHPSHVLHLSETEVSVMTASDAGSSTYNRSGRGLSSDFPLSASSTMGGVGATSTTSSSIGSAHNVLDPKILHQAEYGLPPGPLRFSVKDERSIDEQIQYLPRPDLIAYKNLSQHWEDHRIKQESLRTRNRHKIAFDLSPHWHLRFLRHYCKRDGSFLTDRAYHAERKLKRRFVVLNVYELAPQLHSKTLFPVPGLRTAQGHAMFYMRPSRYFPKTTSTKAVIDNLCYVMNTMLEREHAQQEGIGFIACMDNWKMANFEVNYCYQFMMALQGYMVPVKVQLFMIVNPPTWFRAIWKIMRPMLAPAFRKKVKICPESKIPKYLAPDYRKHLPDDMSTGTVSTDSLVNDFIMYRRSVERELPASRYLNDKIQGEIAFRNRTLGDLDDAGYFSNVAHADDTSSHHGSSRDGDTPHSASSSSSRHPGRLPPAAICGATTTTNSSRSFMWDRTSAGSGESIGNGSGFLMDSVDELEDDDDLASIEADIDDENLMDEEDMKQPAA